MSQGDYARWRSMSFEEMSKRLKRKRVIDEQGGKCLICGIDSWQGELLTLTLDHINGNHQNDSRENLQALCPNCHSQTETFGFKGRTHTLEARRRMSRPQAPIV